MVNLEDLVAFDDDNGTVTAVDFHFADAESMRGAIVNDELTRHQTLSLI